MDKVIKNKRGLELVPSCSSGYKTSCNQVIVWFASATRPNLELKNPTLLGRKMKFWLMPKCSYKDVYIFFTQILCN